MSGVAHTETVEGIGTELVREWTPLGEPKATVVLVHGIAEHSGRYERTGDILADCGYLVRSFDLVGAGGSSGDRWDIDDWSRYHVQLERHMSWARDRGLPVVLMGHSMGGNIALGYVIDARTPPDYLVLSAPALSAGAAWQRVAARMLRSVIPTVSMSNQVRGEQLSNDPAVGEAYFDDPLVHTRSTVRFGAAFFDEMDEVTERCVELEIPTLVLQGGQDTIVPPQSTVILGELACAERRLYPGLQHEILNEPEGPQIVAEIVDWLDERLGASPI